MITISESTKVVLSVFDDKSYGLIGGILSYGYGGSNSRQN